MADVILESFTCPHHGGVAQFSGWGHDDHFVLRCIACSKSVFFILGKQVRSDSGKPIVGPTGPIEVGYVAHYAEGNVIDYYPKRGIKSDESIPKEIAQDYVEAVKVYDAGAPRATVAMCRRAIQAAAIERGANRDKRFMDQIAELREKAIISPSMKDLADTVRMIGNWGAHPQEDSIKEVTGEDANDVVGFTHEFLDQLYTSPARIEKLKSKKGVK